MNKPLSVSDRWYDLILNAHPSNVHDLIQWNFSCNIKAEFSLSYDPAPYRNRPHYTFELNGDTVIMRPRSDFTDIYSEPEKPNAMDKVILRGSGHETAKRFAEGWCTHHLETEWRSWLGSKGTVPENPEGSFVGFVKAFVQKNGAAR